MWIEQTFVPKPGRWIAMSVALHVCVDFKVRCLTNRLLTLDKRWDLK